MRCFFAFFMIGLAGFTYATGLNAVPPAPSYRGGASLPKLQESVEQLRLAINYHEEELATLKEKLGSLDEIIDAWREDQQDTSRAIKERLKNQIASLENKLSPLESSLKSLHGELRPIKEHANEMAGIISKQQGYIQELMSVVDQQNQRIESLYNALKALTEAMQQAALPAMAEAAPHGFHIVKVGDSLEKIAKRYQTSVKTIKELNGLSSDHIRIGQQLKIPDQKS